MKIITYPRKNYCHYVLAKSIYNSLKLKYQIELTEYHDSTYTVDGFSACMKGCVLLFYKDKLFVIDYSDYHITDSIVNHPNLVKYLKCQYNKNITYHPKVSPFFYTTKHPDYYDPLINLMRGVEKTRTELLFKGGLKGRLEYIKSLKDILTSSDRVCDYFTNVLPYYKIGLSLPGHGNICHREFEYLGAGVIPIMPNPDNVQLDPLIPYKHYIPIDSSLKELKNVSDEIRSKYYEILNNEKLQDEIRHNGYVYFDKYCKLDSLTQIFLELTGL